MSLNFIFIAQQHSFLSFMAFNCLLHSWKTISMLACYHVLYPLTCCCVSTGRASELWFVCPKLWFQVCPVCVSFMCGFLYYTLTCSWHFYYNSWLPAILHLYHQGSSKVPCFSFHHFTIYKNGASEWTRVF